MSEITDLYNHSLDNTIKRLSRCLWVHVVEFINTVNPDDIFMDFGCGTGRYMEYALCMLCNNIHGVDASEKMIEETINRVKGSYVAKINEETKNCEQPVYVAKINEETKNCEQPVYVAKCEMMNGNYYQIIEDTKNNMQNIHVSKFDMRTGDYSQIIEYSMGICIAVISHFRTDDERKYAVSGMISRLKPGGKLLIAVWDFEKVPSSKYVNNDKSQPGDYQILLEDKSWYYHLYSHQTFTDFMTELIDPNIHTIEFSASKCNIYCTLRRIALDPVIW
jgi:SAM-dependent methyltransferase